MAEYRNLFSQSKRVRKFVILAAVIVTVLIILGVMVASRAFDWNHSKQTQHLLDLVNSEHPVDPDWSPEFTMLQSGHLICSECANDLEVMLSECRRAGGKPMVFSAYSSESAQLRLIETVAEKMAEGGMETGDAYREAEALVGAPGTSEHQLGYAVDILDEEYETAEGSSTETEDWLQENSWKYGFIPRYASEKVSFHGVTLVPCHYRFVGYEAASQIHELGISLEEYIQLFFS